MKYYYMTITYLKPNCVEFLPIKVTGHIIKAKSLKNAKEISIRHGISSPFNSSKIVKRSYRFLDMRHRIHKNLINRRKQGIGGSIWYEDENRKLKREIKNNER